MGEIAAQNDLGSFNTCSPIKLKIRLVEIGAIWYSLVSLNLRSMWYSLAKAKPACIAQGLPIGFDNHLRLTGQLVGKFQHRCVGRFELGRPPVHHQHFTELRIT